MKFILIKIRRLVYQLVGKLDQFFHVSKPNIIVICYHSINRDMWQHSIDIQTFKQQIEILLKHYASISPNDLLSYFSGNLKISRPSFLLTFDDGYQNILTIKDYLKEKKITPCLSIISDPSKANRVQLNNNLQLLGTLQIKELIKEGWLIGSHSATHADLSVLNYEASEREIVQSKIDLVKNLKTNIDFFTLPRGKSNQHTTQLLSKAGYALCFTMEDGIITRSTNPLAIPRIAVDKTHDITEFPYLFSTSVINLRRLLKQINISKLYE